MVPGSHMAPYTHPATVSGAVQSVTRESLKSAG
jgi:carboxypeptidase C (cathepsin A)